MPKEWKECEKVHKGFWTQWEDVYISVHTCLLSCFTGVWLFAALWTVARQATLGFPRQKYWRAGLLCPPPGNLPDPGIEPKSLLFSALAGGFFSTSATWETPTSVWPVSNSQYQTSFAFCFLIFWLNQGIAFTSPSLFYQWCTSRSWRSG